MPMLCKQAHFLLLFEDHFLSLLLRLLQPTWSEMTDHYLEPIFFVQWEDIKKLALRVLQRWADHVLRAEHNIWRALILYVAAGAIQEALMALYNAQQPDTAAMFILACCEIQEEFNLNLETSSDEVGSSSKDVLINLPGLNPENEDVSAVGEYYGQYMM